MSYIIAIDEGTTSTRSMLYNIEKGTFSATFTRDISQIFPKPGYVEQNANEIYANVLSTLVEAIETTSNSKSVKGIGVTNQRETVIAWERDSGKPLCNAIVWQCRRTLDDIKPIKEQYGDVIKKKTGLIVDPYFSASKMKWILDNVSAAKAAAEKGNLCFGTVDSYIIFKLTEGKSFVTDYSNASRTMLFDINKLDYDEQLLNIFSVKREMLPDVKSCTDVMGYFEYNGIEYPIAGVAGDQQAALFGQNCFEPGQSKITYGTGMFMLFNAGKTPPVSKSGLLSTVAYAVGSDVRYAIEGSVFNAGSAVQWLRDELDFFKNASDSEALALSVPDSGGVYVVPAFTGLGAPYWRGDARGIITGITRGTNRAHITRAVLESIAMSAKTLADCMENDSGVSLKEIRCDGGASANNFLMQFQADVLNVKINRPKERESTALGAVYLCLIALGICTYEEVSKLRKEDKIFPPDGDRKKYEELYSGFKKAVERCLL